MREIFGSRDSSILVKSPNLRQQGARRRRVALCGVLGLAIASGVVGAVSSPKGADPIGQLRIGPFSYFPSE